MTAELRKSTDEEVGGRKERSSGQTNQARSRQQKGNGISKQGPQQETSNRPTVLAEVRQLHRPVGLLIEYRIIHDRG